MVLNLYYSPHCLIIISRLPCPGPWRSRWSWRGQIPYQLFYPSRRKENSSKHIHKSPQPSRPPSTRYPVSPQISPRSSPSTQRNPIAIPSRACGHPANSENLDHPPFDRSCTGCAVVQEKWRVYETINITFISSFGRLRLEAFA